MTAWLLFAAWALPLAMVFFALHRGARWTLLAGNAGALSAALLVPEGTTLSLGAMLLGTELALDETSRGFLLVTTLVWLAGSAAAWFGDGENEQPSRMRVFFLLAMAGQHLATVAADAISFYLGFAVMGLSACGMLAHSSNSAARDAAKVMLAWTIAGEVLLFSGIVLIAHAAGGAGFEKISASTPPAVGVGLVLVGFGIKLGLPGLHGWLPKAYMAATPALAITLSGAMINAGVLGWLRFLPLASGDYAAWGSLLLALGVVAMIVAASIGMLQSNPRAVLAYSSIAKMGVISCALGAALGEPGYAPAIIAAVVVFAAHHALVKAGLFYGAALIERGHRSRAIMVGLGFLSAALAGAPLTSGAVSKIVLKAALPETFGWLGAALLLASFLTTAMMLRFFILCLRCPVSPQINTMPILAGSWSLLLFPAAIFPWYFAAASWSVADTATFIAALGLGLALARSAPRGVQRLIDSVPPGDIFSVLRPRLMRALRRGLTHSEKLHRWTTAQSHRHAQNVFGRCASIEPALRHAENHLYSWPVAGAAWFALGLLFATLLLL